MFSIIVRNYPMVRKYSARMKKKTDQAEETYTSK